MFVFERPGEKSSTREKEIQSSLIRSHTTAYVHRRRNREGTIRFLPVAVPGSHKTSEVATSRGKGSASKKHLSFVNVLNRPKRGLSRTSSEDDTPDRTLQGLESGILVPSSHDDLAFVHEVCFSVPSPLSGTSIGMLHIPGTLDLDLTAMSTRNNAIAANVEAYHTAVNAPYFTRLGYVFNVRPQYADSFRRPESWDVDGTLAVFVGKLYHVEFSLTAEPNHSSDILRNKTHVLTRTRNLLTNAGNRTVESLLDNIVHLACLDRYNGNDTALKAHTDVVRRMMMQRKNPTNNSELEHWRRCIFLLGSSKISELSLLTHLHADLQRREEHFESGEWQKVINRLPTGFRPFAIRSQLSVASIRIVDRAYQVLCRSSKPLTSQQIKALDLPSGDHYTDILQAMNCLSNSALESPTIEQMADLAILLYSGEGMDIGRPANALYFLSRNYLCQVLQAFNPQNEEEREFHIWCWVVATAAWENNGGKLARTGRDMLERFQDRYPSVQIPSDVVKIIPKFFCSIAFLQKIRSFFVPRS